MGEYGEEQSTDGDEWPNKREPHRDIRMQIRRGDGNDSCANGNSTGRIAEKQLPDTDTNVQVMGEYSNGKFTEDDAQFIGQEPRSEEVPRPPEPLPGNTESPLDEQPGEEPPAPNGHETSTLPLPAAEAAQASRWAEVLALHANLPDVENEGAYV